MGLVRSVFLSTFLSLVLRSCTTLSASTFVVTQHQIHKKTGSGDNSNINLLHSSRFINLVSFISSLSMTRIGTSPEWRVIYWYNTIPSPNPYPKEPDHPCKKRPRYVMLQV